MYKNGKKRLFECEKKVLIILKTLEDTYLLWAVKQSGYGAFL